jgi:hypothetical protein
MSWKRNQVVEAIGRLFEPQFVKPSSGLRTRLKRLLETDRGLGTSSRSADRNACILRSLVQRRPEGGKWFSFQNMRPSLL